MDVVRLGNFKRPRGGVADKKEPLKAACFETLKVIVKRRLIGFRLHLDESLFVCCRLFQNDINIAQSGSDFGHTLPARASENQVNQSLEVCPVKCLYHARCNGNHLVIQRTRFDNYRLIDRLNLPQ